MTKAKIFGAASAAAAGAIVVGSMAFAQSAALSVSCSGTVSGTDQIVWSAVASGGNAPYGFSWSNDPSIAGSTASTTTGTYAANGTYAPDVTVTDASSSVATSSCSQSIADIVPPATTSTLNVVVSVNNTDGGTAAESSFTVSVSGADASPSSFAGSDTGTSVTVSGGTNYTVGASSVADYAMTESGNCTGPITAGGADACTVTETYTPPSSAPPAPRVNPPSLSIGTGGEFLSRGMTVTSLGTDSFQATVWGITYTVNWSGSLLQPFSFYYRYGNSAATSTPAEQLQVGDEVGVAGTVSSSSPLVVNASVVRDYSIAAPRSGFRSMGNNGQGNGGNGFGYGLGNGFGGGNGNASSNSGSGNFSNFSNELNQLMQQFQSLQNMFQGRGGR